MDDLNNTDTTNPIIYNKLRQFIESISRRSKTCDSMTKDDLSAVHEALTENKEAGIPSFSKINNCPFRKIVILVKLLLCEIIFNFLNYFFK